MELLSEKERESVKEIEPIVFDQVKSKDISFSRCEYKSDIDNVYKECYRIRLDWVSDDLEYFEEEYCFKITFSKEAFTKFGEMLYKVWATGSLL
jgi:hypothetical protein